MSWISKAPLLIIFCTHAKRCQYPGADACAMQDASIATTQAMLALTALGLGTCWIGAFDPTRVAEVIGAPEGVRPIAILAIGYAEENPEKQRAGRFRSWCTNCKEIGRGSLETRPICRYFSKP
jgi:nitroreductase